VIFDFVLAGLALAPFGLLVLFWIAFREDVGVHPIYRRPGTTTASEIAEPRREALCVGLHNNGGIITRLFFTKVDRY